MNKHFQHLLLALLLLWSCSCSENPIIETPPVTVASVTAINIPGDTVHAGVTTYYRFADSSIVTGSDTLTDRWDIAFRSTTILTNSGSSGPGKGGAQVLTGDFATITAAPFDGYALDSPSSPAIPTGSGNGWYNYDFTTNIITPIAGKVLAVRCGNGNYAKVQIINYYKDAPAAPDENSIPRFYTFRFVYQADGTTNLTK